jgi:hypothetical protein
MRIIIILFSGAFLMSSCSSTNRIFVNRDDFKERSTIKLKQALKGYSDELRRGLSAPYIVNFKHFYSENDQGVEDYVLDISLKTGVRAYEVEPVFYLSVDGKKTMLDAEEKTTRIFQSGSTSSSTETNTSVKEDPENEDEEITETTTTYSTSSSHDTYQLMHMRYHPDLTQMMEIRKSSEVMFKIYIDNEGVEIPFRWRNKRKYIRYLDLVEGNRRFNSN